MTALTADRNTPERSGNSIAMAPAAGVTVYRGALVVMDNTGALRPGRASTTDKALGRAENSNLDEGYDGQITARRGTFRFANSTAGDLIAATDYGATVYVVDDQTVAKTNGGSTRIAAGICRGVDALGVWVEI